MLGASVGSNMMQAFFLLQTTSDNSHVVHYTDPMWSHSIYQLISDNQSAPANDHVLQLKSDGTVSCDGYLDHENSKYIYLYFTLNACC